MKKMTRRQVLKSAGLAAGYLFAAPSILRTFAGSAKPGIEIERIQYVSNQPDIYYGWPTIARRKDGELLVSCSGGREQHVCPFGRVDLFRSQDQGKTWTWPQTLYDGPIDDRDSGLLVTSKGTILATTFTSIAYWEYGMNKEAERRAQGKGRWDDAKFERWMSVHRRISDDQRKKELGSWMIRSEDGGINWSARFRVPVNSPHGPIQGFDGRLIYFGIGLTDKQSPLGAAESLDDGKSWTVFSSIPTQQDFEGKYPFLNELHGIELEKGKFLVHIRNNNTGETVQTESSDNGKSWTKIHSIGVWGLPSHLMRLHDGRLLMSYGYRRDPYRNMIRISEDQGKSWSEAIFLSEGGPARDLGYPSTVQLDDRSLITVWYETRPEDKNASIRLAHWKLT
ncbi:MAG: sialidase family protein [Planctomycetia bacterium]|nr:sialidase family protein [Planctomycetia bacterium]